jgi:predicted CXXCH cytochrome family protein
MQLCPNSGDSRAFLTAEVPLEVVSQAVVANPTDRSANRRSFFIAVRSTLCLLALVSVLPRTFAKVHPVPLEKNADAATCLQCHDDKTKGKSVHSAMQTGCLSCHEVRVTKDTTRVKLITATPAKLCLTCHADKDAAQIKGHVHEPAVRDCLTCHDPHSTDNKNQLLKATSGATKDDNLCLSCHNKGMNVPEKGSRHAALDMGCETCHVTHKTGTELTADNRFHLTKAAPALCLDCHDAKDANLQKAHQNQPFGTANCVSCHDPHQSPSPKLMQAFTHPPFADKSCEMCHAPAKDGKVVLTQKDVKSLCVTCHDEQAKKIESAKVQHPGAAGDCTDCHNPHASSQPGLPKTDAVNICLGCHTDQAELRKKQHLHQPAFEQGCATCHEPHGGDNQHLLRTAKVNDLCLECHGPERNPAKVESAHVLTIFDGKVKLPEDYFKRSRPPVLPLEYGAGHPTERHPISDVTNLSTKAVTAMNCLTCHQPHAGSDNGMLVKDQAPNMAFCRTCHSNPLDLNSMTGSKFGSGGKQ